MTAQEVKRKLTAILSADVKGYSRLMGEDEESTARTLNTYKEVIAGLIQHHHGRVVDAPGDNVLAEFASVVDAVRCAVEIQKELKTRNAELPENRRMEFRIGINLGDVIEEGDKILGDGVNIAARIEGLSEAGGICISGTAFDQVKNKLSVGFQYLGKQTVKNIPDPVRAYNILMGPEAAGKVIGEKEPKETRWGWKAIAAVVALALVAGGLVWNFYFRGQQIERARVDKMAFPSPDLPSIAVLPFVNMSGDPKQEYFSDGLTEEIINGLSKVPRIFVIARNSTFAYKGKTVDIKQVGREMGVKYVLEGSVRRDGNRLRITAQLIDATTGLHLFSERYDRELKSIFATQDEITIKVLTALQVALTEGESVRYQAKGVSNIDAYFKLLEASEAGQRVNRASNARARQLYEEVLTLDPGSSRAYSGLAYTYFWDYWLGSSRPPDESIARGIEVAKKSIALDKDNFQAHGALAMLYVCKGEYEKAVEEAEESASINPGNPGALVILGSTLMHASRFTEAIPVLQKALRFYPGRPFSMCLSNLANSYRCIGQYEQAVQYYKRLLQDQPNHFLGNAGLTATYSQMGRMEDARAQAAEVLRVDPKFSLERYSKTLRYKNLADKERYIDALRKAGLPEKPAASIPPSAAVALKEKTLAPKSEKVAKPTPPPAPKEEAASKEKMAFPLPEVPSIAVMPFVNMSGDPKQEYFSDGMTEEIITALSKLPGLFVIARTSTSTYKGKPAKVKQVAEELGVQYVLEGSVQKSADRIRINAQLIDALTGRHIWAERYNRDLKDIFALQDEITLKILDAVRVKLAGGDVSRVKASYREKLNLDCYLKFMQAMGYSARMNPADNNLARGMAEEAIAICPDHGMGYIILGNLYYFDILLRNTKSPRETLDKAIELAKKALAMDDSIPEAHGILCRLYSLKGEHDKAIAEGERAVALSPSGWGLLTNYGNTLTQTGRPEEAIPFLQKVIRLNPLGPPYIYTNLGAALRMAGRLEEAVSASKKATQLAPDAPGYHADLAATYIMMGREDEARAEVAEVLRINPNFPADFAPVFLAGYKDPSVRPKIIDALRKVGLK